MNIKSALLTGAAGLPVLLAATQASAQSLTLDPPPVRQPLDENGVDLTTGRIVVPSSSVAIGGANGLAHTRTRVGNGWRHNWILSVTARGDPATGTTEFRVQIGGSIHRFTQSGSTFTPVEDERGTLTEDGSGFTYIGGEGTHYRFDKAPVANGESYYEYVRAVGSSVTRPDGHKVTLHYRGGSYANPVFSYLTVYVTRLQSVTSSTGYQLKFDYATNTPSAYEEGGDKWYRVTRVTALNNAQEYCNPAADACALGSQWPYLAYATSSGGTNVNHETVTDILGRQARYTTDGAARLIATKRPGQTSDGMVIIYGNDSRVSSVAHQGQYHRTYSWSASGNDLTSSSTDYLGRARTVVSDTALGVIKTDTNALGQAVTYAHDAKGRVTSITQPEGNRIEFTYDARGRVTQTRRYGKNNEGPITTGATYPTLVGTTTNCANAVTCDKPTTTTDERGKVTNYDWDQVHGGLNDIQLPPDANDIRPRTAMSYGTYYAQAKNASGTLVQSGQGLVLASTIRRCRTANTCVGSANEQVQEIAFNNAVQPNLLPVSVTERAGDGSIASTSAMTWDHLGNVLTVDGPLAGAGDTAAFVYDAAGQQVGTISPDPDGAGTGNPHLATRTTYNLDGQVTKEETGTVSAATTAAWNAFSPTTEVRTTHDAFGRVATRAQVVPGSSAQTGMTQYSYDGAGRPVCTALRMQATLDYIALPASACTQSSGSPDRITQTVHDVADRVTASWSGVGTALAQQTAEIAYNANGTVAWLEDARNFRTGYTYDGFDRSIQITYPHPSLAGTPNAGDYESAAYDAAGNVVTHRTRRGETFAFTYDNLGRMTYKAVPDRAGLALEHTADIAYSYDLFGNLTQATFAQGAFYGRGSTFGYDARSRPTTTADTMSGTTRTLSYGHDAAGRRTSMSYPDGQVYYTQYDLLGRFYYSHISGADSLNHTTYLPHGAAQNQYTYRNDYGWYAYTGHAYDGFLRPSQLVQAFGNGAETVTFGYNAAGQITSHASNNAAFAWPGQPTTNLEAQYTPDGVNRYAQVNAAGYSYDGNGNLTSDGANAYIYDPENRLVSKSGGGKTATLTHDPLGRLWQLAGTTEGVIQFLHDGADVVAEYNSSGAILRRYAHGLSAGDDPVVWWEGAGIAASAKRYLHADERGSIVALGDQNGNYTQVNSYDEFGVPAATNTGRFQYTGQMWLPDAGLYYYKARMYSPTLGRFMQTDPIGYADGLNMYRYVGNDPVNAVDPTGLCTVTHMWSGSSDNPFMKYKGKFSEGCSGGSSPAGMFGLGAPKPGGANPFFGGDPGHGFGHPILESLWDGIGDLLENTTDDFEDAVYLDCSDQQAILNGLTALGLAADAGAVISLGAAQPQFAMGFALTSRLASVGQFAIYAANSKGKEAGIAAVGILVGTGSSFVVAEHGAGPLGQTLASSSGERLFNAAMPAASGLCP